ncbi:MAG TPA: DUF4403 family protein [Cyclobacteriaceae bacterium]
MRIISTILLIVIISACNKTKESPSNQAIDTVEAQYSKPKFKAAFSRENLSTLMFPLDFPVSEMETMVNDVMPKVLVNDVIKLNEKGDQLNLKIEPLGDIMLASYGNNLDASLPMRIRAKFKKKILGLKLKTKKPVDFSIRLDVNTRLSINEDWSLNANCTIQKIRWITEPSKKVFGIKVNLKNMIEKQLEKNSDVVEEAICKGIAKAVPLNQEMEKVWDLMSKPHRVAKKPVKLWLNCQPRIINASVNKNAKDTLRINMLFKGQVEISPEEPLVTDKLSLPINKHNSIVKDGNLDLKVLLTIPYHLLDKVADNLLVEKELSYGELYLNIDDVQSQRYEDQLGILLNTSGTVSSSILVHGRPSLDDAKVLHIKDIGYSIESENTMVNVMDWLTNASFSDYINEHAQISLAHILDSLDSKILKALDKGKAGKKIGLDIHFNQIESDDLLFEENQFQWFFNVKGSAHMYLKAGIVNKKS